VRGFAYRTHSVANIYSDFGGQSAENDFGSKNPQISTQSHIFLFGVGFGFRDFLTSKGWKQSF